MWNAFAASNITAIPIPESKSGTTAAIVTMRRFSAFRRALQFCGSSGVSCGCGQRMVCPSGVVLSLAAKAAPNSMRASLRVGG